MLCFVEQKEYPHYRLVVSHRLEAEITGWMGHFVPMNFQESVHSGNLSSLAIVICENGSGPNNLFRLFFMHV